MLQSPEATADEKPVASSSRKAPPPRGPPGIPAKSLEVKAEASTSRSGKPRDTRKTEIEAAAPKPSPHRAAAPRPKPGPGRSSAGLMQPKRVVPRAKPGPGRSSKGMTVEVESRDPRSKDTKPAPRQARATPARKRKQPVEISDSEDAMDVDEPGVQVNSNERVEPPQSPEHVPPSSDAPGLAAGDYTDADAEGEEDHGSEHHAEIGSAAESEVARTPGQDAEEMVLPEPEAAEAVVPPGDAQPTVSNEQEAEKQPEVEEATDTK